jgi:hypothetical protein
MTEQSPTQWRQSQDGQWQYLARDGYWYDNPNPPPAVPVSGQVPGTNGMAIASLVMGILWLFGIGSILALIFGYVSLRQINQRNESGRGMAIAGVVLGWVGVGGFILFIVLAIVGAHTGHCYYNSNNQVVCN